MRTTQPGWPARLATIVAVLALLIAACGSDDDSATESEASSADFATEEDAGQAGGDGSRGGIDAGVAEGGGEAIEDSAAPPTTVAAAQDEAADEESAGDSDGEGPLGAGGVQVTPTAADLGRKLIFTANLSVEVDDVAAASAEATSIIEDLGGFLFGQNTVGGSQPSSELIFKVLPDDFNEALARLGAVGELRNQSVSTDDVTERIVDLESRIEVAELGVARLRTALEGAPTLEDYAEIERLLLQRESDLEVMRGQLRTLEDRVDLATITLLLTQDRVENAIDVRISAYESHDDGQSCPGQEGRSFEAGSDVTVCFDIVNIGDQTLTDIVLTDTVLDIDGDTELIEVFGSLEELAPGQAVLAAYEFQPERSLRLRTRVVAVPTDGVSPEPAGPSVSTQADFDLRTFQPDRDPGFGDGFGVAVDILRGLWVGLTVAIGFLIPLLVLLPLVWLAWTGWRAYRRRRPPKPTPPTYGPGGGQSPPPPPSPPARSPADGPDGPQVEPESEPAGQVAGAGPTESG